MRGVPTERGRRSRAPEDGQERLQGCAGPRSWRHEGPSLVGSHSLTRSQEHLRCFPGLPVRGRLPGGPSSDQLHQPRTSMWDSEDWAGLPSWTFLPESNSPPGPCMRGPRCGRKPSVTRRRSPVGGRWGFPGWRGDSQDASDATGLGKVDKAARQGGTNHRDTWGLVLAEKVEQNF